jgi:hypothetical protein
VGSQPGPLLILIGGLHGNEVPGVSALQHVFNRLYERPNNFRGRAIAIRGNMAAIAHNQRYIDFDLNRIWDKHHFATIDKLNVVEYHELKEIKRIVDEATANRPERAYLFDLHTTSAPTIPFLVTNYENHDQEFINRLDIPYITGLNGFLDGTILSWFCKKGYTGLAFEAGQHHSRNSIIKHEAFIMLSMHYTGFYPDLHDSEVNWLKEVLDDELKPKHQHFELKERYHIDVDEDFRMQQGFTNFQRVYKGEVLATNQYGRIISNKDGNIFMPLYQQQGDDGFFIIEPVQY